MRPSAWKWSLVLVEAFGAPALLRPVCDPTGAHLNGVWHGHCEAPVAILRIVFHQHNRTIRYSLKFHPSLLRWRQLASVSVTLAPVSMSLGFSSSHLRQSIRSVPGYCSRGTYRSHSARISRVHRAADVKRKITSTPNVLRLSHVP
ncbi:hypothetical protein EI94DRAFT_1039564 [Lactarius quietus]|nr:hypothetical protein EI94DRAFT_1039564 [Lactarius quietus]